jgi:transposase
MEERLRFVARLLDGEGMSAVCREFGISRKTGYKIFDRYKAEGLDALTDRSRRPVRYANQLPGQIERLILESKKDKPHWGARKIRELLVRKLAGDVRIPAKSTVHKEIEDGIWLVSFMQYDLAYIDLEQKTLQTIDSPFGTRLSPMS